MSTDKKNDISTKDANVKMSEQFKDYSYRGASEANSEAEKANQEIQKEFYGSNEDNNLLPFHVDSNSPPIKK
ncbi:hypothetical protein [Bacillus sp. FJAT-29814]|uniref:hypothetical protein n=1 Tax=Bacillus sp. FJAT-29814 TaxID=1729688 RepID=UPI000835DAF5|nr:hypothetical protein [Bacillus sp. FJAT-29814]